MSCILGRYVFCHHIRSHLRDVLETTIRFRVTCHYNSIALGGAYNDSLGILGVRLYAIHFNDCKGVPLDVELTASQSRCTDYAYQITLAWLKAESWRCGSIIEEEGIWRRYVTIAIFRAQILRDKIGLLCMVPGGSEIWIYRCN